MPVIKHKFTGETLYDGPSSGMAGLDLSYGDFRGIQTSPTGGDVSFAGADFTGSILEWADFRGCNLGGVPFTGANINYVDFSKSVLASCDFTELVDTAGVVTNVNFSLSEMSNCHMGGDTAVTYTYWVMSGTRYTGTGTSDIKNVTMQFDLDGLNFKSVDFVGSSITGQIKNTDFEDVSGLLVLGTVMGGSFKSLSSSNLSGMAINGVSIERSFVGNTIQGTGFYDCSMVAPFTNCVTGGESFHRCEINYTGFIGYDLAGVEFYDMAFVYNLFAGGTQVVSVYFRGCHFANKHTLAGVDVGQLEFYDSTINGLDLGSASSLGSLSIHNSSINNFNTYPLEITGGSSFYFDGGPNNNTSIANATVSQENFHGLQNCSSMSRVRVVPRSTASTTRVCLPTAGKSGLPVATDIVVAGLLVNSTVFADTHCVNVDFGNSSLAAKPSNSTFRNCSFQNARFDTSTSTTLSGALFENCDLRGADFSLLADASGNTFTGCDLSFADLSGLDLLNTTFRGCNMFGVNLTGSTNVATKGSFNSLSVPVVSGAVVWDPSSPYVGTASDYNGVILAIDMAEGSSYELNLTPGGEAEQTMYWVSPKQALKWSKENVAPSMGQVSSSYICPSDNVNIIKSSTGVAANISPVLSVVGGYHYIYIFTGSYSGSFTVTASIV